MRANGVVALEKARADLDAAGKFVVALRDVQPGRLFCKSPEIFPRVVVVDECFKVDAGGRAADEFDGDDIAGFDAHLDLRAGLGFEMLFAELVTVRRYPQRGLGLRTVVWAGANSLSGEPSEARNGSPVTREQQYIFRAWVIPTDRRNIIKMANSETASVQNSHNAPTSISRSATFHPK